MNNLLIYIKQRFHPLRFTALGVFLLLFSKANLRFDNTDLYHFCFLIVFLFIMRLYDDLQSAIIDRNKPHRIYTNETVKKGLSNYLILLAVFFLITLEFYDYKLAIKCLIFFIANHFLYLLFFNNINVRPYLSLLKYPLIVAALSNHFDLCTGAILFAFIAFESNDDPTFPHAKSVCFTSSIIAFTLLLPINDHKYIWPFIILFIGADAALLTNKRQASYLFLLFFLFSKLINTL